MSRDNTGSYRRIGSAAAFWLVRPKLLLGGMGFFLLVVGLSAAAITLGSLPISITAIAGWLSRVTPLADIEIFILESLRLPRILLAALTGAMLGLSGMAMQSVTRNGLADPGLIGVKEGAVAGILGLLLFFPMIDPTWRPFAGLAGGALVAAVVFLLARSLDGLRFVLIGIGVSWVLSSGIALFITRARISDVQTAMIWLSGSLHAASWTEIQTIWPWGLGGLALLMLSARAGNVALLGEMTAVSLGVRVRGLKLAWLVAPVAMTAATVSAIGSLGFVGLIAPHLARFIFGANQMPLLAGSALTGAALVLSADTLGRTLFAPVQIPAGIVMAVVGVPFFLVVLWHRRHQI